MLLHDLPQENMVFVKKEKNAKGRILNYQGQSLNSE
jgi:hypothetical protein